MATSRDDLTFEFPAMQPRKRLRELTLHIANASRFNQKFGKVKLAKLLYFADFSAYRLHGKPITGTKYIRLPSGAMPDQFDRLLREMAAAGDAIIEEERVAGYGALRLRMIALREPDYSLFTARQIALVDDLIRTHWDDDGTTLADLSHVMSRAFAVSEAIPYEASLIADQEISQEIIATAQELVKKHGWDVR